MPALTRSVSGLLLREDFSAANGWTAETGWSRIADPALVTWGALPHVLVAPTGSGTAEYDGVREGQLYVEGGTWYFLYDAGDHHTGWRQFLGISTDRGLTLDSRTVQSIQLDDGSSGSYAAVATGWLEKRGSTYYMHRVTTMSAPADGDVNAGLPHDPYAMDQWSASSLTGTWTFVRAESPPGGTWATYQAQPGSVVLNAGTYYRFITAGASYANGYMTGSSAAGPWTLYNAAQTAALSGYYPENPKVFQHPTLLYGGSSPVWVMLQNSFAGGIASRNRINLTSDITDWTGTSPYSASYWTQWASAICDTTGHAVGVQTHVTGPDGELIHEDGFIPFVYDADPLRTSPGWNSGRSIRGAILEPAQNRLHYADATTTPHKYYKTFSHSDFVAEFEADCLSLTSGAYVALEFRTDGSTGYRLMLKMESGGLLRLEKFDGTTIANGTGAALDSGVFLRVKVSAQGTALKAWLNGEKQIDTTDATYSSGTQIAFAGKNTTADVRLFHMRSSDTLTIRGLGAGEQIWLRSHGALPVDTVTANGSGVATYDAAHYPISRVQASLGDGQTNDRLLWGGDDVVYELANMGWTPSWRVQ